MSLVCVLLWLPARLLHVFFGTYMSRNVDVRKAGLVEDVNALALAVAVILLLTSRATFNQAEEDISLQGWANLVQFGPSRPSICASLNQKSLTGSIYSEIRFCCEDSSVDIYENDLRCLGRTSFPLNGTQQEQFEQLLLAMHMDCRAYRMAVTYNIGRRSAVCYSGDDDDLSRVFAAVGIARASPHRWKSLDWISPNKKACRRFYATKGLQLAMRNNTCYYPANATHLDKFPNDLGFPPGTDIVRLLDESNKGLFLGLYCSSKVIWMHA